LCKDCHIIIPYLTETSIYFTYLLPCIIQDRILSGASFAPNSQVRASAMLLLLIRNEVWSWSGLQWNNVRTIFDQNLANGSRFERCEKTDRQTRSVLYALISFTSFIERVIILIILLPQSVRNAVTFICFGTNYPSKELSIFEVRVLSLFCSRRFNKTVYLEGTYLKVGIQMCVLSVA
jgi:hypothetical protein